jgi:hypothetical protein
VAVVRLPDAAAGVVEWAYAGGREVPCLRRVGAAVMLCGRVLTKTRAVGFVPAAQPVDPDPVCPDCAVVMWLRFGVCLACGAMVKLVDGMVGGHGVAVRTRDGVEVLPEPCAGKGMAPEGER